MANLQIKGIDDALYNELKIFAMSENRSVSQQIMYLIKHWLSHQKQFQESRGFARAFRLMAGFPSD